MIFGQNKNNAIINGRFDYWQRGTSSSSSGLLADRWSCVLDGSPGTFSVSRQSFALGQTVVPGNPLYFLRWDRTVASSGSTFTQVQHRIEDVRNFQGKKATLRFWAKADSAQTIIVNPAQDFGTGGSPSAQVGWGDQDAELTTDWKEFTLTWDVPSISGKTIGTSANTSSTVLRFRLPINTTMTFDLANVQMVEGDSIGDFELAGHTLAGELALCQRYYEKNSKVTFRSPYTSVSTATQLIADWYFASRKRSNPSISTTTSTSFVNVVSREEMVRVQRTPNGSVDVLYEVDLIADAEF